jgi:competence protein CoiA
MLWALKNGTRRFAQPIDRADCPSCAAPVLAKCGPIVQWHWAHISECDPWYEPESEWHLKWKRKFPRDWQEVVIGPHRADIKTPDLVVELQASSISPLEITERESFYGDMIWVLRGEDFDCNFDFREQGDYTTFRWKYPRKSWWAARCPIIIDFRLASAYDPTFCDRAYTKEYSIPVGLFLVRKLHANVPCGGWANWIKEPELMRVLLGGAA